VAFVATVFVVWLGAVLLLAALVQAVVSAVARRIGLLSGLKDSLATQDKPDG
jgi:heme exporter protein D